MQYTIKQLYDILHQNVFDIYAIFKNFFDEDKVDLQQEKNEEAFSHDIKAYLYAWNVESNEQEEYEIDDRILQDLKSNLSDNRYFIYIWWPTVTVTNENDKYVIIQDLYAKVTIQLDGRIPYESNGFLLNRATYSQEQFLSDYMHSHINGIPKNNFREFKDPCLGTGPIGDTIMTLKNDPNEVSWMLFCQELSMYVTVESLDGVPWRKLEEIGVTRRTTEFINYTLERKSPSKFLQVFGLQHLKDFIKYYLQHGHLLVSYRNSRYICGMPYFDFMVDISNAFIGFYNEVLSKEEDKASLCFSKQLLNQVLAANGQFYISNTTTPVINYIARYQNKPVLTFKGKEICTNIILNAQGEEEKHITVLLHQDVAMYVLYKILDTINYKYNYVYNKRNQEYKELTTSDCTTVYI